MSLNPWLSIAMDIEFVVKFVVDGANPKVSVTQLYSNPR